MLGGGELYNDPGHDYFTRHNPDRTTRRLIRHLVTLEPWEAPV